METAASLAALLAGLHLQALQLCVSAADAPGAGLQGSNSANNSQRWHAAARA